MEQTVLDTYHKALSINMERDIYGTIAEIGAGQETVRWFFSVGGAAGSIAKAMSAYDMKFSDSIYGPCKRYVSRERLQSMLRNPHNTCKKTGHRCPVFRLLITSSIVWISFFRMLSSKLSFSESFSSLRMVSSAERSLKSRKKP